MNRTNDKWAALAMLVGIAIVMSGPVMILLFVPNPSGLS